MVTLNFFSTQPNTTSKIVVDEIRKVAGIAKNANSCIC